MRVFFDARLAKDDELRARFEAERERIRLAERQPIRLVKAETND
jgi:hypothetical protein